MIGQRMSAINHPPSMVDHQQPTIDDRPMKASRENKEFIEEHGEPPDPREPKEEKQKSNKLETNLDNFRIQNCSILGGEQRQQKIMYNDDRFAHAHTVRII